MSESMESNNKIFNLRITCQKLEEVIYIIYIIFLFIYNIIQYNT